MARTWDGLDRLVETGEPGFGPGRDPVLALNRGLVRAWEIPLDERCAPLETDATLTADALQGALGRSWEEAFERRLEEHHHVATAVAASEVGGRDPAAAKRLTTRRATELAAARAQLAERIRELELRASRLLRCAVLPAVEHSRIGTALDKMRSDPPEALPPAHHRLDVIGTRFNALADQRKSELQSRLTTARPTVEDRVRVEQLLAEEQYDVADELIVGLAQGERLPSSEPRVDLLELFIDALGAFGRAGVDAVAAAKDGTTVGDVDFGSLDERAVRESLEAIEALRMITPSLQSGKLGERLRLIGAVVGLDIVGRSVRPQRGLPKFVVADIEAAPVGGSWVPPEFGSRTGMGLEKGRHGRFRLVVARGSVNEKELLEVVKRQGEQSHRPVILMTAEPLSLPRRRALERQARTEKVAFLLIEAFSLLFQPLGRMQSGASPFDFCW